MPDTFSMPALLEDDSLHQLAGEGAFTRGEKYAQENRASVDEISARQITGQVRGSTRYTVTLLLNRKRLSGDCNCPAAAEGDFCKHQVALAITARGSQNLETHSQVDDLRAFLLAQSPEVLADKLLSFALEYREVEKDLQFWFKSTSASTGADLNKVIGTLLRGGGFIDYRKSFEYARRVDQSVELLRGLLKSKPAECAGAAEYALLRLFKTLEQSDDSSGAISGAMHDLVKIHHKALSAHVPDKKYGQQFFKLMRADGWHFFDAKVYRPLLGDAAWAEYGRLVQSAFHKLPEKPPKKSEWIITRDDIERGQLKSMLETWYALNDDREALLALKIRELQSPYDYSGLIQQFANYGRHRESLLWAEKAHQLFPDDAAFYQALIAGYRHDGLDEEANAMLWQWFERWPSADHFFELMKHAVKQATEWRARAFAYLEQLEQNDLAVARKRNPHAMKNVTTRADILLREKNVAEAVAIARGAVISQYLITTLADKARKEFPDVSSRIYRNEVDDLLRIGGNRNYELALDYLNKLLPLLADSERFAYLNDLRIRFKAKRNFIKLIAAL